MKSVYKKVQLIHKEPNEECFEILKSAIVEDKVLKKFRIDQHTLIANLPEKVINSFLDFLAQYESEQRKFIIQSIKRGAITVKCEEEFDAPVSDKKARKPSLGNRKNNPEGQQLKLNF